MKRILTGLILVLAGSAASGELPTRDEVLNRFAEAVGGKEALQAREQLCYEGTIVQDLAWKDPAHIEVPFRACAEKTGRLLYVESADWADLPGTDSGDPNLKLRWLMHPEFALTVEEFFPELEVRHREMRAGRGVIVLAPKAMKFEYYALYFDEETGLLNHVGYHNDLKDWRMVNGVLFPHTFIFGRKGGHTTYQFERVGAKP